MNVHAIAEVQEELSAAAKCEKEAAASHPGVAAGEPVPWDSAEKRAGLASLENFASSK